MPSHNLTFLLSYLRPKAGAGPRRSQSRWAGGGIISIPRRIFCPRAPTVLPALLFGPERVKPNQQGYHSAMGLALGEVGGEVVNCRRRVEQEGGCGGLSSEVEWMGTSWSQSQWVVSGSRRKRESISPEASVYPSFIFLGSLWHLDSFWWCVFSPLYLSFTKQTNSQPVDFVSYHHFVDRSAQAQLWNYQSYNISFALISPE